MAPLSRNCVVTADLTSNQLVAAPRSLYHLNGLPVSEAPVACWAAIRRCDQGLVGLAVRTVEEVGEEATGLTHRYPGVTAGGRVVERATAHVEGLEAV